VNTHLFRPFFLFALLVFAQACFLLPASADSIVDRATTAAQLKSISPEACLANAKGMHLVQIQTACCKDHKGICGCRAGKIVCCDNSTSKEPGCTCHGDEGIAE
jgi:hypothetical protein